MGETGQTTLSLSGDVMLGRGIDQILPHPCDPTLHERYMKSALGYVELAERINGPIKRPVDFKYIWGDALAAVANQRPDVWLINLETAVTTSDEWTPKGINYRMNPLNINAMTSAGIDCCGLANNHVLDWGKAGLLETLETLGRAGIRFAGAGRNHEEAEKPAIIEVPNGRLLVFAGGLASSGIPANWSATKSQPGINLLREDIDLAISEFGDRVAACKTRGDVAVASLHWGVNWGYEVPREQSSFARGLIEHAGVDVVFGHSSHHPKAIEVHQGKLILYGCGDFINDYEGIGGHQSFRGDLVLLYFVTLNQADGTVTELRITPFHLCKFRLNQPPRHDVIWVSNMLNRQSQEYGAQFEIDAGKTIMLAKTAADIRQ